jgi:hypothetical protein
LVSLARDSFHEFVDSRCVTVTDLTFSTLKKSRLSQDSGLGSRLLKDSATRLAPAVLSLSIT